MKTTYSLTGVGEHFNIHGYKLPDFKFLTFEKVWSKDLFIIEATGKASGVRCTVFLVEETEAIKEHACNHLRASDCLVSWWPSENEIYHVRSITCRLCYFKLK